MNKKKFLKLDFGLILLFGIILTQIPLNFADAKIIDSENFNKEAVDNKDISQLSEDIEIPRLKELPTPSTIEFDNGMVVKKAIEIYGMEKDTPIFQEAMERLAREEVKSKTDKTEAVLPTPIPTAFEDNNKF